MSKLNSGLSYKDWCILKHGLENSIKDKDEWISANSDGLYNPMKDEIKELEEEKRTLKRVTELVDRFKERIR